MTSSIKPIKIKPIKRTKVSLTVAAKLQEILLSGEYEAGDKLPSEMILAERFGVSRSSIREAVKLLEAEGLVRVAHGVGTIVNDHEAGVKNDLAEFLVIDGTTVPDLIEARIVLESEMAFQAAKRLTSSDAKVLRQILRKLNDETLTVEEYVEADVTLHLAIAQATKNKVFIHIFENLKKTFIEYSLRVIKVPGRREKANEGHQALVEAILARSPSAARKAAIEHVEVVEREIVELFEGGGTHVSASNDKLLDF